MKKFDSVRIKIDINSIKKYTIGFILEINESMPNNRIYLVQFVCDKKNWMKLEEIENVKIFTGKPARSGGGMILK
jgi:hypothetical protein